MDASSMIPMIGSMMGGGGSKQPVEQDSALARLQALQTLQAQQNQRAQPLGQLSVPSQQPPPGFAAFDSAQPRNESVPVNQPDPYQRLMAMRRGY